MRCGEGIRKEKQISGLCGAAGQKISSKIR